MKFLYALRREVFALHARAPQNLLKTPSALPPSIIEQRGVPSLVRHGQGCGSGCGCVIDVQVEVDQRGTVTDACFAAKRVALGADGSPLTSRTGKLLVHDCPCDALHSFGSIATSECKGQTLESLRNRLLFSPTAPPSFLRTLVRNVGAPRAAAVCAQVVEAALTTALTDRPYSNPLASYTGAGPLPSASPARITAAGDEDLAREADVDDDDDLAEVDFRQQYDDFA